MIKEFSNNTKIRRHAQIWLRVFSPFTIKHCSQSSTVFKNLQDIFITAIHKYHIHLNYWLFENSKKYFVKRLPIPYHHTSFQVTSRKNTIEIYHRMQCTNALPFVVTFHPLSENTSVLFKRIRPYRRFLLHL